MTFSGNIKLGIPGKIRQGVAAAILLVVPAQISHRILKVFGYRVSPSAGVGFSLIFCDQIDLHPGSRIGHFNLIKTPSLTLQEDAAIGNMNFICGPIKVNLGNRAAIGNRNVVTRAPIGVTSGEAELKLGDLSKITASHSIDCASSVTFGNFSILAGKGSQIWTHGYVHDENGPGRYRVDGRVELGNNVYIGSRAIITGGVSVKDGISVGAGVVVTRNLNVPGFYVSSAIRVLPRPKDPQMRDDMKRLEDPGLVETVYVKK